MESAATNEERTSQLAGAPSPLQQAPLAYPFHALCRRANVSAMSEPQVFVHRARAGGCYGLMLLLGVFPIMALGSFLPAPSGPTITTVAVFALVLVAAVVFAMIVSEHRLALEGTTLRLTEREIAFGVTRATKVVWELPISELTSVNEVNTRTPSSRGGWNRGAALHFPGDRVLPDHMLGSKEIPSSEYNRLVRWLRERLQDRFTSEERH
jgi:hypothetical protein